MIFHRKKLQQTCPTENGSVLLLLDWDNIFYSLFNSFKDETRLEERLKKLNDWIKTEIGPIFGGYGFVFAPGHLGFHDQRLCVENKLRLIICPKRTFETPKLNQKTGLMCSEEDTVDETLIWYGKIMMGHPDIKFICLVSGDDDYVPLMKFARSCGIKRILVPPTIDSLSRSKNLIRSVDRHPITRKKMILRLDSI